MKYTTAKETYFDAQGIIAYYERLGKTATADYFRGIDERDTDIVRHGQITWIPQSFVRRWVDLSSASPDIAKEVYGNLEYDVIQWIPTPGDTQEEIEQVYARVTRA